MRITRLLALAVILTLVATTLVTASLGIAPRQAFAASGVVNTYTVATVAGGVPDSSGLSASDCALVVQMTGSVADGLGTYEILDPANTTPTRTYSNTAVVQFVVLPGGCAAAQTVDGGGVEAQPWNGSTGGVVFLGGTSLTMSDDIDVTGAGYSQTNGPNAGADGGDGILPNSLNDDYYTAGGGGGGVLGGGGGGGTINWPTFRTNIAEAGLGGQLNAGGLPGESAPGVIGGVGGSPVGPGNGGSSAVVFADTVPGTSEVGAGGAGGGNYGGGGASCGSLFSSAYSGAGGGGASWTGGGLPGTGGSSTAPGAFNELGTATPGAEQPAVTMPLEGTVSGEHYLHADDPRLMMGGAGGDHYLGAGGGAGGGLVVLAFDSVIGGGNQILANGARGSSPVEGPASGAGGGAGGNILIAAPAVSAISVIANGAPGGDTVPGRFHTGSSGAGGGAGAIWFSGAGDDATNTGGSQGATSADSTLAAAGLTGVNWQVVGAGPGSVSDDDDPVLASLGFTAVEWNALYNQAALATFPNTLLDELSALTGISTVNLVVAFPSLERPDNPKNAGVGCTASSGGNGLVRVSAPPAPTLQIEKSTNGQDSDSAPGETLIAGSVVTWQYEVTVGGTGTVDAVTVTDDLVAAADISCDVDGDDVFESSNQVGSVSAPATFTCQATGTAITGAYSNVGTVTGTSQGGPLEETDPSNYTGQVPSITIEKQTNGVEADDDLLNDGTESPASTSDGASNLVVVGAPVTWTFQVTNNGPLPLTDVVVTDQTTTANDANHAITVACDWLTSSDAATDPFNLSIGETVTCTATGTAGTGLHENTATVTGNAAGRQDIGLDGLPVFDNNANPVFSPNPAGTFDAALDAAGAEISVDDSDASGYEGSLPSISIVKIVAGTADGDVADVVDGQAVSWEFEVTNTGAGALNNVTISDPVLDGLGVTISCPQTTLALGESMTCTASSAAGADDVTNTAFVTGDPAGGGPSVNDADVASYVVGVPAITVDKLTCTDPASIPGSCSDGPQIPIDDDLAWSYVITNSGEVTLVGVTLADDIETGVTNAQCDWANSSDAATGANVLSVGETVSCLQPGTATLGQYDNVATTTGVPGATDGTATVDPLGDPLAAVTDDDPSSYFGTVVPSIDIEKDTNGFQADTGTGPLILEGNPVEWTFVVSNTGNTDLADVVVTDTVTTDNGTTPDPVVCDWVNSSNSGTPAETLSVGETVTCTASSTAELGQYANNSDVVGTPVDDASAAVPTQLTDAAGGLLADVVDEDPSAYFGPDPSIDIEKDTNGNQADVLADQDTLAVDDAVDWTFVVTNTGNTDLAGVVVADAVTTDNGTVPDPGGAVCDWDSSSDAATPAGTLSAGETVTCTASSLAQAGQYRNDSTVTGTPVADATTTDPANPVALVDEDGNVLSDVTDADPSHYFGAADPAIDIEKDTNNNQADVIADQDIIGIGADVTWTFVVENTGDVDLAGVVVTDVVTTDNGTVADPGGVVCDWTNSSVAATPDGNLAVGETVTCTSSSVAAPGQYANRADVTGTPVADAVTADPNAPTPLTDINGAPLGDVVDDDPSHYFGAADPAIDIEKDTNGEQADTGTGPLVLVDGDVTWTFVVTNVGNVTLGDVTVADVVTTDNGTVADPAGVVCDWTGSSVAGTPIGVLDPAETVTCTASSVAAAGQYRNNSTVTGQPLDANGDPLEDTNGNVVPVVEDQDPSGYFGTAASIDIEKDTNGNQADVVDDQDTYAVGDTIDWTFVVTNDGNVDLSDVRVSDTVTTDNDTTPDPVVCDWAGTSTDGATGERNLSVGESVTCTASSTAEAGQYANNADVAGTPVADATTADPDNPVRLTDALGNALEDVTDEDPSHYFGAASPSIDIEKNTNGNQADVAADQDTLAPGDDITWTFLVTNDGNVDLADVRVSDVVSIDNGTAADPAGVTCDWSTSTNPATPDRNLSVGESVSCTSTSTAAPGQYRNDSSVVGTPVSDAVAADPDAPLALQDIDGNDLADVTDADPSHYYAEPSPAIDIEKDTNGDQADTGTGPIVILGDPVTWTFVVRNTGNVLLGNIVVTDVVTTDNGTTPGIIDCDWANSSDPATPAGRLSVDETVTCTSDSVAAEGQYINNGNVSGRPLTDNGTTLTGPDGSPLDPVTDQDRSAYFGPAASIDIEKDTNGNQADVLGDQDTYEVGDDIVWTFEVVNDGNVDLAGVVVTDTVTTDNNTTADPSGVACDWVGSSDAATPPGNLSVGETVTCTAASVAAAGQYANLADVTGTPVTDAVTADANNPVPLQDEDGTALGDVTDDDPSHYFAEPRPEIDIEKDTNGNQADTIADQDILPIDGPVTWTFVVTNTGNTDLANVQVTDVVSTDNLTPADPAGVVCDWDGSSDGNTPAGNLAVGETVTCSSTSTAQPGQYGNESAVVGTPVSNAVTADPQNPTPLADVAGAPLADVDDDDPSHYFGQAIPAIMIEKDTNGFQADTGTGPLIFEGNPVTWSFVVTNTGTTDLANVLVLDAVTTNNSTAPDPGGVVCDWDNSSVAATPARNLARGETVTCSAESSAQLGQYANNSTVTGTPVLDAVSTDPDAAVRLLDSDGAPLSNVNDADPSAYFGPDPSLDIQKTVNGEAADLPEDVVTVIVAQPMTWVYQVVNDGNVDLAGVVVTDTATIDNGTVLDDPGVVCDWATSSDPNTGPGNLSIDETVTCEATGRAEAGRYRNDGSVTGTPVADAALADPNDPDPLRDETGAVLPRPSDSDPAHYFATPNPIISIEKDTNGNQADELADQDSIDLGEPIEWTFVVTNSGDVDLSDVRVSDAVTTENGTAVDPGGVVCDWATSTNPATPPRNLAVFESVTCTASSTAAAGQYANLATAIGTPVLDATTADPDNPVVLTDFDANPIGDANDEDPSHYYGNDAPSIDIEKDTNGVQADEATDTGPLVVPGNAVSWTFELENTGNIALGDVGVTDVVTTDNGTVPDAAGVVCDWANSSDDTTADGILSVGETVTCSASSSAAAGQYRNNATVVGTPLAFDGSVLLTIDGEPSDPVTDEDPSAYFGPVPAIDIEKDTNGNQADALVDQDSYVIGDDVSWTFVVTNSGNTDLSAVVVTDTVTTDNLTVDDPAGVVCAWDTSSDPDTAAGNLSVGETVTCTSSSTAEAGQYANNSSVVGTPVADAATADPLNPVRLQDAAGGDLGDVSDEDPSHYFGTAAPSIDIEKDTNGNQADLLVDQDAIALGTDVTWTFVVVNEGDVDLADVTVIDTVTTDNGTAADPAGVVCDWANSSDDATPVGNLSVGETVTCTASSTAVAGQYANNSQVTGTPVADATLDTPVVLTDIDGVDLADVTDEDPSHYIGTADPAIDIEKDTNGVQADAATDTGPLVVPGDPVVWTFEVANTGNVALGDVGVTDVVTTDNGTVADAAGVVCDWANSSDDTTADGILSVGETVTCTASSSAAAGQYNNNATVVGTPLANDGSPLVGPDGQQVPNATDEDPSAYFGPEASIDIEKDTNGNQADLLADQDSYTVGDAIVWTFLVTNDGNVDLANIQAADVVTIDNNGVVDPNGVVCDWTNSSDGTTPPGNLSVGETVSCTSNSTAAAGQYANLSDVVGTPVADAVTADPVNPTPLADESGAALADVTDEDPSHYFATPTPSIDIEKDTNGNQADAIGDQDTLAVGSDVTWTFVVTNDGTTALANVQVTDTVTTDNNTPTDPAGVVCDWANSSDANTPDGNLSIGETVTCTSTSTAAAGQYANLSNVVGTPVIDAVTADPVNPTPMVDLAGTPLGNASDEDPSHYNGNAVPAIRIDKDTNGVQADGATDIGPVVFEGDPVTWTFVVTNFGNADLAGVEVTDTVTTDNGTTPDPAGVVCDWANSSDANTPDRNLSIGETVTCTASSTAALGQYRNLSNVAGTPVANAETADPDNPIRLTDTLGAELADVTDEDPSAYFGPNASIDIEKDTNGNQADALTDQDLIATGDTVTWTFEVENTGNVDLANVQVNDTVTTDNNTPIDPNGVVCDWANSSDADTPAGNLSIGETVTCASTSTAAAGQYANNSDVVGTPVADAVTADPVNPTPLADQSGAALADVTDEDPSHYFGESSPSIDIEKDTNGNQADVITDQDVIALGTDVTWTFVVVNDGNVDLADVTVTDTVTTDNGTAADPAGVVCDWANSSDDATPVGNLSVGETVTCTASSTAVAGQYANLGGVVGTPVDDASSATPVPLNDANGAQLADVTDDDPSHYFGGSMPSIDIEKDTNGNQADTIDSQDMLAIGEPVTWTFVVTNNGNVDLADVSVADTVVTDNGTVADPDGVVCDWANSSDPATDAGRLTVNETVTCTSTSEAAAGQYANNGVTTGTAVVDATVPTPVPLTGVDGANLPAVIDEDASHYFGPVFDLALRQTLLDTTNLATVATGDSVTFEVTIFNQGNVAASNIELVEYLPDGVVLDDPNWTIGPDGSATRVLDGVVLQPGESMKVTVTTKVTATSTDVDLVVKGEIAAADPVADDGEVLQALSKGVLAPIPDIDSVPDTDNDETPVEDAIDNESGDEDDHDQAAIRVVSAAAPTNPTNPTRVNPAPVGPGTITNPPPQPASPGIVPDLALTGSDSRPLALAGLMAVLAGIAVLSFAGGLRRRHRGRQDELM